jgi:hypothetical protein
LLRQTSCDFCAPTLEPGYSSPMCGYPAVLWCPQHHGMAGSNNPRQC